MGRGQGGRFKREGIYVFLWLIHVEVWRKTTKFWLIKNFKKGVSQLCDEENKASLWAYVVAQMLKNLPAKQETQELLLLFWIPQTVLPFFGEITEQLTPEQCGVWITQVHLYVDIFNKGVLTILHLCGFPRLFSGKESACQCRRHKRC